MPCMCFFFLKMYYSAIYWRIKLSTSVKVKYPVHLIVKRHSKMFNQTYLFAEDCFPKNKLRKCCHWREKTIQSHERKRELYNSQLASAKL